MINVNQITAQLARMPDQTLQQFAAMHKNDPYTVSLALSESNRRKQMRTASQMPQGEQPKVVDQQVAEMVAPQAPAQAMPEDTGIGALPAGDMEFADGGIVGYADGGLNFNERAAQQYEDKGSIYSPFFGMSPAEQQRMQQMADQRSASDFAEQSLAVTQNNAAALAANAQQKLTELQANREALTRRFGAQQYERALNKAQADITAATSRGQELVGQQTERGQSRIAQATPPPAFTRPGMDKDPRMAPDFQVPDRPAPQSAPTADTGRRAAPGADQGIEQLLAPRAPRAASSTAPAAPTTAGDFMAQYDAARKGRKVDDPFAQQEADLREKEEAAAKENLAAFDKDMAERGDFRAGQKERLTKREAELGKERSTLKGLAFLEAGLATMQSTGRGLSGIAQGASVGVKSYTAGLDKLKTAQEKLDDARDKIAEAQDTESQLTKAQRRTLMADAAKTTNQGLRSYIAAQRGLLTKDEQLTQTAVASDIATQRALAQQRSQENIAAQNRAALAGRAEGATGKLDLERLKAQAKLLQDQLKETPNYGPGKAKRVALENALQDIQTQMSGGTIAPPSAAAAPGGTPRMRFDAQGNPIK